MMRSWLNLRLCLLLCLIYGSAAAHGNNTKVDFDTIKVTDYGARPDSRQDATLFVQEALKACSTKRHPLLVFPKGRYDFWYQHSTKVVYHESNTTDINPRNCAIWIKGANGLVVDAQGSAFIFHGRVQPFTIDSSMDITVKNVSIDWDIPLTAQGEVADTAAGYIDLRIDSSAYPFHIVQGKLIFTGEGWESAWWGTMEFASKTHLIVPRTGDDGVLGDNWQHYEAEKLPGGLVRLHYSFTHKPAPGNMLVLRHSERDHAGIFIVHSRDVRLENIELYHTAGLGILSQYAENLNFHRVSVIPSGNRYFSGHDDGCHFSNCKGQIVVDSCAFEGLMDDPINVHGTAVKIIERKSDHTLLCRFVHPQSIGMEWAQLGDNVGMINHLTMQTAAYGTVVAFHPLDTRDFLIDFDKPVPEGIIAGDALENISWTPDVTIRHCFFGSNRARGLLVSTPGKVRIEDNIFESSGSAILIPGDANGWYESGAVKDVLIRHNKFLDPCLTSMYQFCEGIISIDPEIPQLDSLAPFHRNIRIEDNEFHPFDYPVLYAKSVDGLVFRDNILIRSHRFTPFHYRKYTFTFVACKNVKLKHNRFRGDVLGRNIKLEKMPEEELKR